MTFRVKDKCINEATMRFLVHTKSARVANRRNTNRDSLKPETVVKSSDRETLDAPYKITVLSGG